MNYTGLTESILFSSTKEEPKYSMCENYSITIENIIEERNHSKSLEFTGESSSRTCTSTNTSKSEHNELESSIVRIEGESGLCSLTSHEIYGGYTLSDLSSTISNKCQAEKDMKNGVNAALAGSLNILQENPLHLLSYEITDSYQTKQNIADFELPSTIVNMKACETCKRLHDGSFASGRFCSSRCARTVGGIARKMQRLRSRNKENIVRTAVQDKYSTARKVLERTWTEIPRQDVNIVPTRKHRIYSNSIGITHSLPMVKYSTDQQQYFQIAASLCSLEYADKKMAEEQKHEYEEESNFDVIKGQHFKIDIASLINEN